MNFLLLAKDPAPYQKPLDALAPRYAEWLESHTQIVYPVLAALAVFLITVAIFSALIPTEFSTEQKDVLRPRVILELRQFQQGYTTAELVARLGVAPKKFKKYLDEMARNGLITTYKNENGQLRWVVKGVSTFG